jgi:UDP-glucose 4-epimerase
VINLAKALVGERKIEIKETGIRPGEKIHEIMVSEEECHHAVARGPKYFAILPMLPDLRGDVPKDVLGKEFSSADTVVDAAASAALLRKHRLMPDQAESGEILR